jgi:hypothetical protein
MADSQKRLADASKNKDWKAKPKAKADLNDLEVRAVRCRAVGPCSQVEDYMVSQVEAAAR